MKPFSLNCKPLLLGGALVLSQNPAFSQSFDFKTPAASPALPSGALGQTLGAAATGAAAPDSLVQVRVELLDVTCLDQQEFFGSDEFFVLWVLSEFHREPYAAGQYRGKTHFGTSRPLSIKKGERKAVSAGGVFFEGVLPSGSSLSGRMIAMEEDQTRSWKDADWNRRNDAMLAQIDKDLAPRRSGL